MNNNYTQNKIYTRNLSCYVISKIGDYEAMLSELEQLDDDELYAEAIKFRTIRK